MFEAQPEQIEALLIKRGVNPHISYPPALVFALKLFTSAKYLLLQ
jgi:hypothetical protein